MRAFFIIPLFLLILPGCAQRLDEFETRFADLDERTRILESKSGLPVGSDRELLEGRRLADVRTQVATMKNELTILKGKVEALEFENKALSDRLSQLSKEADQKTSQLKQKLEKSLAQQDPAEYQYRQALNYHQAGNFEKSREIFLDFVRKYSKNALADNAIYWIAQSYMGEKSYRKALVRFQDLVEKYPKSDKKCDAMARQVEAFQALGMNDEAKAYADVRTKECRKSQ